MIVGLGNDIIEIERVRRLIEKFGEHCVGRIYTPIEWAYCWQRGNPFASFAARFAAKEAVAKALGVGFGARLSLTSIEVYNNEMGAPQVRLYAPQTLLPQYEPGKIKIALSHCRTFASAVAIIMA